MRKRSMGIALLLAFAVFGCNDSPTVPPPVTAPPTTMPPATPTPDPILSLQGSWERINRSFVALDGMIVQTNPAVARGVITSTPANIYQFAAGDLKWRNITRRSNSEFDFEDLVRQANTGAQSYVPGIIEVQPGGQQLRIRFPTTGTFQQWRKRP